MTDTGDNRSPKLVGGEQEERDYLQAILQTMRHPLLALDGALTVEMANDAFLSAFRVSKAETEGTKIYDLGNGQWNIPKLRELLENTLLTDQEVSDYRVEHDFEQVGRRVMMLNAYRIRRGGCDDRILLSIEDVTELERSRQKLTAQKEYADKIVDASRDALLILDWDLRVQTANETFFETFQVEAAETEGQLVYDLGNGQWDIPALRELLEDVLPENNAFNDFVVDHEFETIGRKTMVLNARRVNHMHLILLAIEDQTEVRRAAARIQKSEARFRALVSASADAMFTMAPDCSELRLLDADGKSDDASTDTSWFETCIPPEEQDGVKDALAKAASAKEPFTIEHRVKRQDGSTGWISSRAVPLLDDHDEIREWFGTVTDTSAAKRAGAALRESEERYRMLFDSIDQGFCVIEMLYDGEGRPQDYRFLEVNKAFAPQTGLKGAKGRLMRDLEPNHEEFWFETYGRIALTRKPERFEHEAMFLNRYFEVYAFPFGAPEDRQVGILFRNVADQKEAADALRRSEERLRNAVEVGKLGLWDWNLRTGDVHWSEEHFRMEGYAVEEVEPSYEAWAKRIHPDDLERTEVALRHARETGERYDHEFRVVHPDGATRWLSARGQFFYGRDGKPVRMIGAMADMTERRHLEERQKVLISELQHRTMNLLGVIQALAERTARTSAGLTDFRSRFRERLQALSRVQRLLSRLDDHDRVTFDELLDAEISAVFGQNERVTLEGPKDILLRSSSVQTLAMALHELMTNAVKYGALRQSAGQLAIRWSLEALEGEGEPTLHIDWRESGVDMPAEGAEPEGTGQGRQLIERALPHQLNAKTSYEMGPDGVHCVISVPVSRHNSAVQRHGN